MKSHRLMSCLVVGACLLSVGLPAGAAAAGDTGLDLDRMAFDVATRPDGKGRTNVISPAGWTVLSRRRTSGGSGAPAYGAGWRRSPAVSRAPCSAP